MLKEKDIEEFVTLEVKPTIPGENEVGFEVWLFNFSGDLYDKELTAYFVSFFAGREKVCFSYAIKRTDYKRYGFGEANTFSEREANGIRNRFFTEVCKTEKKSWKIVERKILVISL